MLGTSSLKGIYCMKSIHIHHTEREMSKPQVEIAPKFGSGSVQWQQVKERHVNAVQKMRREGEERYRAEAIRGCPFWGSPDIKENYSGPALIPLFD